MEKKERKYESVPFRGEMRGGSEKRGREEKKKKGGWMMGGKRRRRWVGTRERHKCLKEAVSDEVFSNACAYVGFSHREIEFMCIS